MNKFMKMAIDEAKKGIADNHGGPFGAVIVKDGKVVSKGHNRVVLTNDPTCHGEIDAIRKATKKLGTFDLRGCELYTTGYPCPMCLCAMLWANIDKAYYGCKIEDTEAIGFRDNRFEDNMNDIFKKMCVEVDREECLNLYQEYLNNPNKTMY